MVQAVRMPMMGNTMETGLLAEWVVSEGDDVNEDDVLAVVESEKAAADVVAGQDGTLARIDVAEGEEVPPGTLIGVVLGPNKGLDDAPAPRSRVEPGETDGSEAGESETEETEPVNGQVAEGGDSDTTEDVRAAPGARKLAAERDVELRDLEGTGPEGAVLRADVEEHLEQGEPTPGIVQDETETAEGRVFASPSTRRLARELDVSMTDLDGTSAGGRITESDVRAAAGEVTQQPSAPSPGAAGDATRPPDRTVSDADELEVTIDEEQTLSGMRRTIADRMSRSARHAPHVTLNREVSVDRAFETADDLTEGDESSVGFTDLLVGAAVRALDHHPRFNAWFEGEELRLVSERNVAIAVDTEAGLVTPVIREADDRTLQGIAGERRDLTETVLSGEYSMDHLQGGTFTISNLGMFDVDSFDPIINPPQVAILGVGRVRCDDGRVCTLSLSFDHRVVDGADAARFLDTLARGVEAPVVVVAERSAAGAQSPTAAEEAPVAESGVESIDELVRRDISERARDIAAVHDWPTPTFGVRLDGDRPVVTVRAPESSSPASMKRLAYAACRESMYAGTITRLLDPEIELS